MVQRIFNLCIAGKSPMQIAKILTADRVLTVTAYHARQKGWACLLYTSSPSAWTLMWAPHMVG